MAPRRRQQHVIDSSDIEVDEPAPDRLARAGARSINAMQSNASAIRIQSKKAVKQLQAVSGAPSTRYQRARWGNAWKAFFQEVLQKEADTMPTGQDLERFLMSIPSTTRSSLGRKELSWTTLQTAQKYALHAIRMEHDSFKLTYQDRHRLKDCFETLRLQGQITKDPAREAQWLTARLMTYLNRALLVNAIRFGVLDWSIVVQKCLGLALQSALSCRAGDMSVSSAYTDNECLLYKDIQLKITVDDEVPGEMELLDRVCLEAKITLRHTKNFKRDGSHNHIIVLSSVDDLEFNVVDSLKLLLAHALRQEAIEDAITAKEAVEKALSHPRQLIQWKHPERPVICSLAAKRLNYDTGAKTSQLLQVLNEAGQLSGVSQRLVTHDIRRGAAADAVRIRSQISIDNAARAMDHSANAVRAGVTAKYVGHDRQSHWEERLHLEPDDEFGLQLLDARNLHNEKKRKVSSLEIDEYLQRPENAHLHRLKVPRHAATLAINKVRAEAATNGQQLSSVAKRGNLQDKQPDQTSDATDRTPDEDLSNIDPALLLLSGIVPKSPFVQSQSNPHPGTGEDTSTALVTQPMEDVLEQLDLEASRPAATSVVLACQAEIQGLEGPASSFLAWLSSINTRVVNDTNPKQHAKLDHLRGGSRAEPTFFVHHCKYEGQGCTFSTTSGPSMQHHEEVCTSENREAAAKKVLSRKCDVDGCSYVARAETEQSLRKKINRHRGDMHTVKEVSCTIGGYADCAKPFKNAAALSRHKAKFHANIVPQRCKVEGCRSQTL